MRLLSRESGVSKLAILFWIVVLGLIIHVLLKVVPNYIDYGMMKDLMSVKASMGQVTKDEEILADLVKKAKEQGLPLEAEDFVLQRQEDQGMKISTKSGWDVEVRFLGGHYVRTFHYDPVVEEKFESKK